MLTRKLINLATSSVLLLIATFAYADGTQLSDATAASVLDNWRFRDENRQALVSLQTELQREKENNAVLKEFFAQAESLRASRAISEDEYRETAARLQQNELRQKEIQAEIRANQELQKILTGQAAILSGTVPNLAEFAKLYSSHWQARLEAAELALKRATIEHDFRLWLYNSASSLRQQNAISMKDVLEVTQKERLSATDVQGLENKIKQIRCIIGEYETVSQSRLLITEDVAKQGHCALN